MMEDFSGLALPPLFGGHILEAELEPDGVELDARELETTTTTEVELGPAGSELLESNTQEDDERRAIDKRKYLALNRRCKEIEQVNQKTLGRLHQIQRITRRLKKERRFLMKALDAHRDDYRNAQLTILLEEESAGRLDPASAAEEDRLNGVSGSASLSSFHPAVGPKKKRHRVPRPEKDKDQQQSEASTSGLAETQFGEMPSPASLSH